MQLVVTNTIILIFIMKMINQMKLYTEEQVRTALYLSSNCTLATNCEVLNQLTPIELPSDEEIEERSIYSLLDYTSYKSGAKWMKEQILNKNK